MPFVVTRGRYHRRGYKPDGDFVCFEAENGTTWGRLDGRVALNARGHAKLRLEAIDTLDTLFERRHQPMDLAQRTDRLRPAAILNNSPLALRSSFPP